MKKITLTVLGLSVLLFTLAGCSKNNTKKQTETDHQLILNYITSHNLKGQFTSSGLYYVILKSGNAKHPTLSSTLDTDYKGYFLDGKVFDQGTGVSFPLSRVIKGWQEILPLMPTGAKWKIVIPPQLAYGERGAGGLIGPNETLIFEIELISIDK